MKGKAPELDQLLDQALAEIRDQALDPHAERSVGERVWSRVSQELAARPQPREDRHQIRDCDDFQALIPAYLRGGLNEAKTLLLQDHVTECLPCRKALKQARSAHSRRRDEAVSSDERGWASTWTWRLAIAAVIVIALVGLSVRTDVFTLQTGGLIRIQAIEGAVFKISGDGAVPVSAGDEVDFQDAKLLRTGKGASAMLLLEDDSRVEVSERAELTIHERRKLWERGRGDSVIDLARGSVIIEASPQGSGHMYVDTADARVAVTGTVFAVNRGMKGSRVTVIEGQVEVNHSGATDVLSPGQQATTHPGLGKVPIADEIAWSKQREKHLALLREFAALGREIDASVASPGKRYDTSLLDRAPTGTAVYVAIPNLSSTLGQAYDLMQQKISGNALLREWWDESVVATGADDNIATAMDKIRSYGRQLGEEIVVAVAPRGDQADPQVVIYTELTDAPAFVDMMRDELDRLADTSGAPRIVLWVDDELESTAASAEMYLWAHGGFLALSPDVASLRAFSATLQHGGASEFYGSTFHGRLAELYSEGVEWVIGVDVESLRGAGVSPDAEGSSELEALGILDLQHVIGQRREFDGRSENRAVLTFDQPRRGVASWLAEPAPMGSLNFISPNAYFAAGFVMKEPVQVVDELIDFLGQTDSGFVAGLDQFEAEHAIDVRQDIAAAIGGEFAFALDGPVLPKPSWKLIVEVYDPARLQHTLEWAAARLNELMREHDRRGFALQSQERGNHTFHELKSLDTGLSAHYTFVDGYLVASASRALLDRALQFRAQKLSVASSPGFLALLPEDGQINFSAVVYQNWDSVLGPLSRALEQGAPSASAETRSFLSQLSVLSGPNLTVAYGEPNRIVLVNTAEGGLLGRGLTSILSLHSLLDVQQCLGEAVQEERAGERPAPQDTSEVDVRDTRGTAAG